MRTLARIVALGATLLVTPACRVSINVRRDVANTCGCVSSPDFDEMWRCMERCDAAGWPLLAPGHALDLEDIRREITELVNGERTKQGLVALVPNPQLAVAAQAQSQILSTSGHFSHDHGSSTPTTRARDAGYPGGVGENIAMGQVSSADVMSSWMTSPGHRANILRPEYRHIGVGMVCSPACHWTQVFGEP